ncbi:MAG: DNA internalization-related competence protein ComEC/Rec2 [Desulfobacteraceae bacterium]|nr:DNA internalization-related competence protein ComEC/Rec2 [Desulfobacteraceae bacterium]
MATQRGCSQTGPGRPQPAAFYRLPVLVLLFAYTAGIIPGRLLPFSAPVLTIIWLLLAGSGLRVLCLLFKNRPARISPLILFFTLGFLAISAWQPEFFPPDKAAIFLKSGDVEISGTLAAPAQKDPRRTICILEDLEIRDASDGKAVSVHGRLRGCLYGYGPKLLAGDRISLQAKIRSFKNFNNPGGFNYRQYMAYRNIWGNIYASFKDIKILPAKPSIAQMLRHSIHRFRDRLDSAIRESGDSESTAVLSALIVGKRHRIDQGLREAFNRAGASHLLAISGLHVGIVATCAFLVFRLILSYSKALLLRGWTVRATALLSLMPVAAYVAISGISPSTQRAGIMVAVFLFAFILEKPYHSANTLAVAALLILAVYPPGLFSISFQLSFAAVSAIFFGLYVFSDTFIFRRNSQIQGAIPRFLNRIFIFAMISLFAILGTMPLVMHYFNQAAIAGIISNLILIPWIGFAVVPAGLISAMAFAFSETIGTWCLTAADRMLDPALDLIYAIAGFRFGSFNTVTPGILELICIYLLMICIGLAIKTRFKQYRKPVVIMLCLVVSVTAADAGGWLHSRFFHKDLRITVLDVGQGFSSLVEFPKGETMLIDGGGFSDNAVFDVGRLIVAPYLRKNKIGKIDTVILSHPDADHLNGLLYILENFRVKKIIAGPSDAETNSWRRFLQIIEEKQIQHPGFENTKTSRDINGARIDLLYPDPDIKNPDARCTGLNNRSLVLRIQYRQKSILFPGDIEKCAESAIVAKKARRAASDILIAPHHGSKTSSSDDFLKAVNPETVIISARQSGFKAPSKQVLERYEQMGCRILRTDENGAVRIRVANSGEMNIKPSIRKNQRK